MCLGKAITGGYMSFAATLATDNVAKTISEAEPYVFMHGPTFMGNPLACSLASASLDLLDENNWQKQVNNIESILNQILPKAKSFDSVADVRILGAIGVIEMKEAVDMEYIQQAFVEAGVWLRPFGKLIYTMPPYVISDKDLEFLLNRMIGVIAKL